MKLCYTKNNNLFSNAADKKVKIMKLTKGQMVTVSFMLFSLFFGAGNLIFPPFLGQNAAQNTAPAFLGFLITAVVLPVWHNRSLNTALSLF